MRTNRESKRKNNWRRWKRGRDEERKKGKGGETIKRVENRVRKGEEKEKREGGK